MALGIAPPSARAQSKPARIGILGFGARPNAQEPIYQAVVQGLLEAGYVEGRNLVIEGRFADANAQRLPGLAAELVQAQVDVILVFGPAPMAEAGRILGLEVLPPNIVRTAQDLPEAFAHMKRQRTDAVLVATGGPLNSARAQVAELAIAHRLPTVAALKSFPQAGLLMSYGPDLPDIYRRGASYVDRILKGAKSGDLPIELPTKYELVINRHTAKALGLTIPTSLLVRADEVIQ